MIERHESWSVTETSNLGVSSLGPGIAQDTETLLQCFIEAGGYTWQEGAGGMGCFVDSDGKSGLGEEVQTALSTSVPVCELAGRCSLSAALSDVETGLSPDERVLVLRCANVLFDTESAALRQQAICSKTHAEAGRAFGAWAVDTVHKLS